MTILDLVHLTQVDVAVYPDTHTSRSSHGNHRRINGFKAALTRTSSGAGESATVLPFAIFSGFTEGRSAA